MKIILILATNSQRVIGIQNRLPWQISGDLKFFKRETTGHAIVMGRSTLDSLRRKLLDRYIYGLTRQSSHPHADDVYPDPDSVIKDAKNKGFDKLFVAGGSMTYDAFLPFADSIIESIVECKVEAEGTILWPSSKTARWRGRIYTGNRINDIPEPERFSPDGARVISVNTYNLIEEKEKKP